MSETRVVTQAEQALDFLVQTINGATRLPASNNEIGQAVLLLRRELQMLYAAREAADAPKKEGVVVPMEKSMK